MCSSRKGNSGIRDLTECLPTVPINVCNFATGFCLFRTKLIILPDIADLNIKCYVAVLR